MRTIQSKYFGFLILVLFAFFFIWSLGPMKNIEKKLETATGSKEMLDLKPSSSAEEIYVYINKIGPSGCEVLKEMYTFQDLIFPLAYGLFFGFGLLFFISRSFPERKKLLWFSLAAFLMMMTDYLENFSLLKIVSNPSEQLIIANYVGVFTSVKWMLGVVTIVLFLIFLLIFLVKKVFRKKTS
jgi:hypothetical protein